MLAGSYQPTSRACTNREPARLTFLRPVLMSRFTDWPWHAGWRDTGPCVTGEPLHAGWKIRGGDRYQHSRAIPEAISASARRTWIAWLLRDAARFVDRHKYKAAAAAPAAAASNKPPKREPCRECRRNASCCGSRLKWTSSREDGAVDVLRKRCSRYLPEPVKDTQGRRMAAAAEQQTRAWHHHSWRQHRTRQGRHRRERWWRPPAAQHGSVRARWRPGTQRKRVRWQHLQRSESMRGCFVLASDICCDIKCSSDCTKKCALWVSDLQACKPPHPWQFQQPSRT